MPQNHRVWFMNENIEQLKTHIKEKVSLGLRGENLDWVSELECILKALKLIQPDTKFKVGDKVAIYGTIIAVDPGCCLPYKVAFKDGDYGWHDDLLMTKITDE